MKRHSRHGFTLVEILTVIVVILIIAAFTIGTVGVAMTNAAKTRARGEIQTLSLACTSYKADNGTYPRQAGITEGVGTSDAPIDPKKHGNPSAPNYQKASQFLYMELSGDKDLNGVWNGAAEGAKPYMNFNPRMLGVTKDSAGNVQKVNFIQDPFGVSYGYSTAGARVEEGFQAEAAVQADHATPRDPNSPGYNPTYDLWSTGGAKVTASSRPLTDLDRQQWVKNW